MRQASGDATRVYEAGRVISTAGLVVAEASSQPPPHAFSLSILQLAKQERLDKMGLQLAVRSPQLLQRRRW
jgi:hypothetical protein